MGALKPFSTGFSAMGCPCECKVYAETAKQASDAFDAVRLEVDRLDRKYSHYRDDSRIRKIQKKASEKEGAQVDSETASLLDYAQAQWELSDGLFDITAHHLTRLWSETREIPVPAALDKAIALTGWHRVAWDGKRLRLPVGYSFDLGGLVKEYGADRAALVLRQHGLHHGYVDLGGDFHFIGAHPDGQNWRVGIRNPESRQQALASVALGNGGLASSGDYERFNELEGKRYSHLVDARTGWPLERTPDSLSAVSVIAPSCLVAGSVCTLAMLMGRKQGLVLLEESGLSWVAVTGDGHVHSNSYTNLRMHSQS